MRPLTRPRLSGDETKITIVESNDNYRTFVETLLKYFDAYCVFCESPLAGGWSVEHRVAQSTSNRGSDEIINNWGNLLPACYQCNGTKGKRIGSEHDMGMVVWPDVHNTLVIFRYNKDGTVAVAKDRIRENLSAVCAMKQDIPEQQRNQFADRIIAKAENTIELFQLNRSTASDQRTSFRENAYALAQSFFNAGVGSQLELFKKVVKSTGYWSVWVQVFSHSSNPGDRNFVASALRTLLEKDFLHGTATDADGKPTVSIDGADSLKFSPQPETVEAIYQDENYNSKLMCLPTEKELQDFLEKIKSDKGAARLKPSPAPSKRSNRIEARNRQPIQSHPKILSRAALKQESWARRGSSEEEEPPRKRKRGDPDAMQIDLDVTSPNKSELSIRIPIDVVKEALLEDEDRS